MARGKSRLFGNTRGRRVEPNEELIENFVVNVDDLEFDSLFIESRQQYVYNRDKDTTERVTFFKPKSNIILGGRTVSMQGEDFLDFIMNIMGELGDTSKMNMKEIREVRKRVHKRIITDFQSDDWENVIEKYKNRMHKRDIHLLRVAVDNSTFSPSIASAIPLKHENVDSSNIIDFIREYGEGIFDKFDGSEAIVDENYSDNYTIKGGFDIYDFDGKVIITPFMSVNNERFDFDSTCIYPTEAWKNDVSDVLRRDMPFIEDLTGFTTINARRPLKRRDDKFFRRIVKNLKGKFHSERSEIPKDMFDDILLSFEKNLDKYCDSKEFGDSNVCIDLALNKSIAPYSFTPRVKRKVREVMLRFSGDVL